MGSQYIKLNDEIIAVNKAGLYPEKVLNEGDSLKADVNIHSFFWKYNGPYNSPDYEPVGVDKDKKFVLTRFHERGAILWIDYKSEDSKAIVSFFTHFHTPMLCTNHSPHVVKEPTLFEDRLAYAGLFLAYFFPKDVSRAIKKKGHYGTRNYSRVFTNDDVPDEKKFKWSKLEYIIIVGPDIDLDALKISENVKDELRSVVRKRPG